MTEKADEPQNPIQAWRKRNGLKRAEARRVLAFTDSYYGGLISGGYKITEQTRRVMQLWESVPARTRAELLKEWKAAEEEAVSDQPAAEAS